MMPMPHAQPPSSPSRALALLAQLPADLARKPAPQKFDLFFSNTASSPRLQEVRP